MRKIVGAVAAKKEYPFLAALAASALAHAIAMSVVFVPVPKLELPPEPMLTAVLVNAATPRAPGKAKHIAQANLDGGGAVEEESDPSSPAERSDELNAALGEKERAREAQERVRRLEEEVARMAATAKRSDWSMSVGAGEPNPDEESERKARLDLAAKIEREMVAYAQRPKKMFLGASAMESDAALWVEAWQRKVESMGNRFYPEAARGKIRGALIMTAGIRKNGEIESATIDKSSGEKVLDEAALRILRLSAPFESFGGTLGKKADILYITRQWQFGPDGSVRMESVGEM